jgi:hypothetical protein
MLAERVPRARDCAREGSGGEQWVAQLFRQILHSNDLVDCRPNQRELQPLGHSDIAIDNLAQVERYAEMECYVGRCRLRRAESPARFLGCGERPAASLVRRTLTSKSRNAIAIADGGRGGEVRYLGEFPTTEAAIRKLVAKLAAKYRDLMFCYEAGPTGYGLYRLLKSLGHECLVVAAWIAPLNRGSLNSSQIRGTLVPVEEPSTASKADLNPR